MFINKLFAKLPALHPRLTSLDLPRKSYLDRCFANENGDILDLYYRLGDTASKELLIKLITHSIGMFLTSDLEKYRMYSAYEWQSLCDKAHEFFCIKDTFWSDIVETFVLDGYSYADKCSVEPGDIVIDCGAYTGNTALYFSQRAGDQGKVYAFEAMPQTYKELKENVSAYTMKNVIPVNMALTDKKCELAFTQTAGPASCELPGSRKENGIKVSAISLDEFINENRVEHVDFIKMDIEGGELDALLGASKTIERFKPKLAISVYHKPQDMIDIPKKILELDPGYTFYLKHNYWKFTETVLFCVYGDQKCLALPHDIVTEKDTAAKAWEYILQYKLSLINEYRKYTLTMCNALFLQNMEQKFIQSFSDDYSQCTYYLDDSVKYELRFSGGTLHAGVEINEGIAGARQIIQEILSANRQDKQLQLSKDGCACAYQLAHLDNLPHIVHLLRYLVDLSFPLLVRHGSCR